MKLKGMLLSFSNPILGPIPQIVPFQYNPAQVTRVFQTVTPTGGGTSQAAPHPAGETYSMTVEIDATDGLEKGGPVTTVLGVAPRLAMIEQLVHPSGGDLFGDLAAAVGGLLGGGETSAKIPPSTVPLVLFFWGPARLTPVRLTSLTIRETSFDELLNPIQASADLGLTVLQKKDIPKDETITRAAADYYQAARLVKVVAGLPQILELDL